MIKSLKLKFRGIEPILDIRTETKDKHYKSHIQYGLFGIFRKLKWKLECSKIKMAIEDLGYEPVKCEGCGEGWSEYSIEEPNEKFGTYKRIFVCRGCVGFYDWKCTRSGLYRSPIDFRG